MPYTTPRTWTTGETVTAAMLNEQVRDNENYLKTQMDIADREQIIDVITATTTLTGVTTEQTAYTFSLPGGSLGSTGMIRLKLYGVFTEATGGQTDTFRFKYGATTLVSVVGASNASAQAVEITFVLKGNGATNAQLGVAKVDFAVVTVDAGGTGTSAIDSTTAQNVVVTYQSTNASASFVVYMATLAVLPAV